MKNSIQGLDRALRKIKAGLLTASRGQTLVEYSLILAFVASMVVALGLFIGGTNGLLGDIESTLAGVFG